MGRGAQASGQTITLVILSLFLFNNNNEGNESTCMVSALC